MRRALLLGFLLAACGRRIEHQKPGAGRANADRTIPATAAPAPSAAPSPEPRAASCEAQIVAAERAPRLEGAPLSGARRAETFARAKADGVLFVDAPAHALAERGEGEEGARILSSILKAEDPVRALYKAYPTLRKRPSWARAVFLTDGYLYATSPALAAAFVALAHPEDLFRAPALWILRGERVIHAVKRRDGYVYAPDEAEAGARVKLFLFDRVAVSREALKAPLHRDVEALARRLGFEEMRPLYLSKHVVVADLRYGAEWVPSLLDSDGAHLELRCEAIPKGRAAAVEGSRRDALRRISVVDRLRAVMREQVEEKLPFDEPKTEVGQQDGKLRQNWNWAYRFGQSRFEFNDDEYKVFDARGRPRVPQVCIDFVTDTFERVSGSWYRPRGEPRERIPGRLDFASLGIDNERSVEHFIDFAKTHPALFDVFEVPPQERIPYAHRAEFFAELYAHRDRYRPGDVVVIFGLRSDGKLHYHSFIVYESDPVTGAPSLVAANAGRPRIRPWESEMTSAPERSVVARIRPRLDWLESVQAPLGERADLGGTPKAASIPAQPATAI